VGRRQERLYTVQSAGAGAGEVYNKQLSQDTEQERQGSEQESVFREQLHG
jgi:hypothetical protein